MEKKNKSRNKVTTKKSKKYRMEWKDIGDYSVLADKTGRVIGSVYWGVEGKPEEPVPAYVNGKKIGDYIGAIHAMSAVEDALNRYGLED